MTDAFSEGWRAVSAEAGSGTYERRLAPDLPLYVTVTNPGKLPGLLLRVDELLTFEAGEVRGSEQFEVGINSHGQATEVHLFAKSEEAGEIFLRIAEDLVSRVLQRSSPAAAAITLVRRFNTWQRFLRQSSGGALSETKRLGLFGELATLRDLMVPTVGAAAAVECWTGPDKAPQDFQTGRMAVEVKTIVHSEPQVLVIDGERQLDDFGLEVLILAHHRVFRYRGSGQTLPELVAEIRELIGESGSAMDRFDERLLDYGYSDLHADSHYCGTGYAVKDSSHYRVREGFPRLTEADLRAGMGALRYSIAAAVCERFMVTVEDIRAWLSEPRSELEPDTSPESSTVEYKQTLWAPVGEFQNEQHKAKVSRALQTAVIKSVVALMNSDGGDLVIGVRDADRAVTGIEADLAARGLDPADFDAYERELLTLLTNHVDELVHRQVRIEFQAHEGGTACHVAVAPSPTPRFGRPAPAPNERASPVFWVRMGNSTKALEGSDMVDYIAHHWT